MEPSEETFYRNPRSASILSATQSTFARGSLNSSNKFYKGQSQCFVCQQAFSKSPESKLKRHCCQFCFNAVCQPCSPLTLHSVITNKAERCCSTCLTVHSKEKIDQEAEKIFKQALNAETELRLAESNARKEAETKYEDLVNQIDRQQEEKNKEIEKLKGEIDLEQRRNEESQREINEIRLGYEELERKLNEKNRLVEEKVIESKTHTTDQRYIELNEEVKCLKEENEGLKKRIQVLMTETKASSCGCFIT